MSENGSSMLNCGEYSAVSSCPLGPGQTPYFTWAESNANEGELRVFLICIPFASGGVQRLTLALKYQIEISDPTFQLSLKLKKYQFSQLIGSHFIVDSSIDLVTFSLWHTWQRREVRWHIVITLGLNRLEKQEKDLSEVRYFQGPRASTLQSKMTTYSFERAFNLEEKRMHQQKVWFVMVSIGCSTKHFRFPMSSRTLQ